MPTDLIGALRLYAPQFREELQRGLLNTFIGTAITFHPAWPEPKHRLVGTKMGNQPGEDHQRIVWILISGYDEQRRARSPRLRRHQAVPRG